jgi:ADP-heptose:LPS heptosyltransferase
MRILLARPDHLGDVLLTLPAVMALRSALPGTHIGFLVADGVAPLPRHCPAVDATITAPFPPLSAWPDPAGWADVVAEEAPALRGRFDLAILPRPDDPMSGALVAAADVPIRLGYATPRTRPYLTVALPPPGRRHVAATAADLALAAAEHLGAPVRADAGGAPCFVPTADDEGEASSALGASLRDGKGGPIVLHPGSGWPIKNWSTPRWGRLAATIARRYGTSPLVTGGPSERMLVRAVVDASGGRARGLAGILSLGGLAALFRRARLVIATDSGPLHLAAMVGAPVVGLYGPADPIEFGPWCPERRRRIVRVQLACSPCRTLEDPPCGEPVEPRCVREICVEAVLEAAADLLGARIRRRSIDVRPQHAR